MVHIETIPGTRAKRVHVLTQTGAAHTFTVYGALTHDDIGALEATACVLDILGEAYGIVGSA